MTTQFELLLLDVSSRAVECGEQGDCGTDPTPQQAATIQAHTDACNALRAYIVREYVPVWRAEPPTQPGYFYWLRHKTKSRVEIGFLRESDRWDSKHTILVCNMTDGATISEHSFRLFDWSGPLQPPQEKV